ncbi:MAG: ATPase [Desulfatitalea sp.]|nr:ATPase [Desulfatitalea sp.]
MANERIFAGVDVGSSRTKTVLMDASKQVIGHDVRHSGTVFSQTAEDGLKVALDMAKRPRSAIAKTVSTGYGRHNVTFSNATKTEIACHAKGSYYFFPKEIAIIDIGGQDNKIIKLDPLGGRRGFKMNRKCAAGTGAFLEEMSLRLNIPLEEMDAHAAQSEDMVKLGSYCTVFSGTEVLENIRNGEPVAAIIKGLFFSVIKRVLEMDSLSDNVVMTGGVVAHNPHLAEMAAEIIGKPVLVPKLPQFTGAIGAALYAMDTH